MQLLENCVKANQLSFDVRSIRVYARSQITNMLGVTVMRVGLNRMKTEREKKRYKRRTRYSGVCPESIENMRVLPLFTYSWNCLITLYFH